MKFWSAFTAALWSLFSYVGAAAACPSCPIGRAARQQVCDDDFLLRLVAVLAPFIVIAGVTVWVERALDRARGSL